MIGSSVTSVAVADHRSCGTTAMIDEHADAAAVVPSYAHASPPTGSRIAMLRDGRPVPVPIRSVLRNLRGIVPPLSIRFCPYRSPARWTSRSRM